MSGNKVTFGLKNVYVAPLTVSNGVISYETPFHVPGGVELSLEPRGDMTGFYADDMLFYSASNNQGYDGTLSIANIPEQFSVKVLAEEKDATDGVLTEKANAKPKNFAMMFEFDGDKKAVRHVLYNCTANRPTVSSSTKTGSVEPNPNELTFISSPRETDKAVKYKKQFGSDYFTDLMKMESLTRIKGEPTYEDLQTLDMEVFYNICWVMAKTADNSIPEPLEWLDTFDEFPLFEILPELQDLLTQSLQSKKK